MAEHPWAIELENVTKTYPAVVAAQNITFKVAKGQVMGLLGPNGAGKSTTMKMIAGLLAPDSGQVLLNGKHWEPWDSARPIVGLLLEEPPLYPELTVQSYLAMVAGLYSMKGARAKEAINSVVERLRLQEVFRRPTHALSKGYKQRLGLAQALLPNPPILLLDEPTNGLDPHSIREMRELILGLRGEHTLLLSSHHLQEVEYLCQSITIIDRGQIKFCGPLSEARTRYGQAQKLRLVFSSWRPEWTHAIPDNFKVLHSGPQLENPLEYEIEIQTTSALDLRLEVFQWAQEKGLPLLEVSRVPIALEELFMNAMGGVG